MPATVPAVPARATVPGGGAEAFVPDRSSMRTLLSALRPSGHLALVRLPEGARFTAVYADDPDEAVRDITHLVADLLLAGALDAQEAATSGQVAPLETVEVVTVTYAEPLLPGQVRGTSSFTWAHVPSSEGGDFDPREVLALVVRGISVELTAGVAAEAAEGTVPDDVAALEGDAA